MKNKVCRLLIRYLIITIAAFLYAVGVSMFLDPNNIIAGGVTGISMILNRLTQIPVGSLILLINIPILTVGLIKFGIRFILSTIYATLCVSGFTNILENMRALTMSPFLASIAGNTMIALALGCIFKCHATTGGMDIIVKLLRIRFPHIRTGNLFLIADISVVGISGFFLADLDHVLYALIGVMILGMVFDMVLYGRDEAKMIYIVSSKTRSIADRVLDEVEAGVTFLNGKGAYSGQNMEVILCIVKKNVTPKIENIVKEMDQGAFMIITNATEIYGEGYKDIMAGKL